jgi:TRAP-type C4-dicarboxylate transport system permease small subunit
MAIIEIKRNPGRRELLWFGLLFLIFFGIIGAMIYWKFDAPTTAYRVWIAAVLLAGLYYVCPPVRRPLYLGWMYAAYPIGFVVSYTVMLVIYYLVVTPIGLILRGMRRDSLCRRFDPAAKSYWIERGAEPDQQRYFRQF